MSRKELKSSKHDGLTTSENGIGWFRAKIEANIRQVINSLDEQSQITLKYLEQKGYKDMILNYFKLELYDWDVETSIKYYHKDRFCIQYSCSHCKPQYSKEDGQNIGFKCGLQHWFKLLSCKQLRLCSHAPTLKMNQLVIEYLVYTRDTRQDYQLKLLRLYPVVLVTSGNIHPLLKLKEFEDYYAKKFDIIREDINRKTKTCHELIESLIIYFGDLEKAEHYCGMTISWQSDDFRRWKQAFAVGKLLRRIAAENQKADGEKYLYSEVIALSVKFYDRFYELTRKDMSNIQNEASKKGIVSRKYDAYGEFLSEVGESEKALLVFDEAIGLCTWKGQTKQEVVQSINDHIQAARAKK